MKRFYVLKILFFLLGSLIVAPVSADDSPVLKEQIVVHDEIVTLGDLFENAGIYKNIPVFRSPDFGTDGVISAQRVQIAAQKHGLIWENPGNLDKLVVRRPSRVISLKDIKKLLGPSLSDKTGISNLEDLTITFALGTKDIHIDSKISAPLITMSLWYDPRTKAFRSQIGTEETTGNIPRAIVTGRVDQTALVVMPVKILEPGIEIGESDLKTARLPVARLRSGYISSLKQAVGKAAKYRLGPNQILRSRDLEVPKIIKANEIVEIRYQVPGLSLKAQGRALGSGARGEVISVLNTRSNRKIQAVIQSPGVVIPADNTVRVLRQPGS